MYSIRQARFFCSLDKGPPDTSGTRFGKEDSEWCAADHEVQPTVAVDVDKLCSGAVIGSDTPQRRDIDESGWGNGVLGKGCGGGVNLDASPTHCYNFRMLASVRAVVSAITRADAQSIEFTALVEGETTPRRAIAYPALTGPVATGDTVTLNTTATQMNLGTGGVDFVMTVENRTLPAAFGEPVGDEHIIKLRYTPLQHAVRTPEMDPAYTGTWEMASTLMQSPVVVCGLHSQIAPVAGGIKAARPDARIAYVWTDSAALPLAFSQLVRSLKEVGLIDVTLTAGQAFGGDYECVSDASALLAARWVARADVVIVAPGPGNAGTGTRFGFSGVEQGQLLDLAGRLWGTPIGVLRLSLADKRDRHFGLSHHSVTSLGLLAHAPAIIAWPTQPEGISAKVYRDLQETVENSPIAALHTLGTADGAPGLRFLVERGIAVASMGRTVEQDPLFFSAAAAAGAIAADKIRVRPVSG
jgi:hypothetical protein